MNRFQCTTKTLRQRLTNPKNSQQKKGFTLVELMIGMLVLVIGIMATMAMQSSALAGYSASRDSTAAAELGRSVEHMLKTESTSWRNGGWTLPPTGIFSFGDNATATPLLLTVHNSTWNWVRLSANPTDNSFSEQGPQRFCTYLRGGRRLPEAPNNFMLLAQIVVVYPAARGNFVGNTCPTTIDFNPADSEELELSGLRASYFATQITPRLSSSAPGGI